MPALRPDQLADFVTLTLHKYIRNKWSDIALDLQQYIAMSHLLSDGRDSFDGGEMLSWQVKVANTQNARNTGLFDEDKTTIADGFVTASVPWTFQTVSWAYDEREDVFQSSMERIVSVVRAREHMAMSDLAELLEMNFFGTPANPNDQEEKLKPYGLRYWFVRNPTEGFTGTVPSGFTNVANISPTTYPNWSNWSAAYQSISKQDLVRKWRKASVYTKFKSPVKFPETGTKARWVYLTNYAVLGPLEEILEAQNSSLGNDLASKDGQVLFRRNPVVFAPYLDADSQNPIYGINWGKFKVVFKTGEYMKRSKPIMSKDNHRVRAIFLDNSTQFKCLDRRQGGFVLYQAAA